MKAWQTKNLAYSIIWNAAKIKQSLTCMKGGSNFWKPPTRLEEAKCMWKLEISEWNQIGLFLIRPLKQAAEPMAGLAEITIVLPRIVGLAK